MAAGRSIRAAIGAALIGACLAMLNVTGVHARTPAMPGCVPESYPSNWLVLEERDGGHTLERHVGKSKSYLKSRLQRERRIPAASSFRNRQIARQALSRTLTYNSRKLNAWANSGSAGKRKVVEGRSINKVGTVVPRDGEAVTTRRFKIVLEIKKPGDCYILTAYPVR